MLRFDNIWQHVGLESRELSTSLGIKAASLVIKNVGKKELNSKIGLKVSGQAVLNTGSPIIIG